MDRVNIKENAATKIMNACTLKVTFYGMVIFTFIGIAIFAFVVRQNYEETAIYQNERLRITKRNGNFIISDVKHEANASETHLGEAKRHRRRRRMRHKHKRSKKSIVILYWTPVFSRTPLVNFNPDAWPFFYAGSRCPIKCNLTTDKRRASEASALVVHSRNIEELPPKIYKNLTWIIHTNENPIYTPSLRDPGIMSQFNYSVSYRLDSDFPCPEFRKPNLEPPIEFEEKKGLVMVAMSNCEPVRTFYVQQLMKFLKVDSYGACLRNKPGLEKLGKKTSRHTLMELQRNYKFSLVFPNADCDYYMTEKIYSALSAGSVPIWLGTDTIDEVLKWGNLNHSVIKVRDFSSPKVLAEYILKLAENEEEYNTFLKWKYEGFRFPAEYYDSVIGTWWDGIPLYCRVCMRIAEDPHGHSGLPVDKCDGSQSRTAGKWLKNTDLTTSNTQDKVTDDEDD